MKENNTKVKLATRVDLKGLASQAGKDSNRFFFSTLGDLVECRVPSTRKHGEKAPAAGRLPFTFISYGRCTK